MDNVERQVRYAGGGTAADVLALIRDGRENENLTPAQRRRKRLKRGGTRRAQTPRPQETIPATPSPGKSGRFQGVGLADPTGPQVVEVFGQRWEIP
jgi:hypothetical protein